MNADVVIPAELPLLPIHRAVLFPGHFVKFRVASQKGTQLCEHLAKRMSSMVRHFAGPSALHVGVTTVVSNRLTPESLHPIGTVAKVVELNRLASGKGFLLVVRGIVRFRCNVVIQETPYFKARITALPDTFPEDDEEFQAQVQAFRQVMASFVRSLRLEGGIARNLRTIAKSAPLGSLCDALVTVWAGKLSLKKKLELLDAVDLRQRIELTMKLLREHTGPDRSASGWGSGEEEGAEFGVEPSGQGSGSPEKDAIAALGEALESAGIPEPAKEPIMREYGRLSRMKPSSIEYDILRTYMEWVSALPWSVSTEDNLDLNAAQRILDEDHMGLEKIKRRIVEFLAVRTLRQDMKGPILCFVGPPGVGKTSLGKSIARALGRNFHRIALGGVRDESVIRGHRRTYVGALPGRILDGLKKAGSNNPVVLLDEIDKLGQGIRGDPAAALLEVLDPEQNHAFNDNYLNAPFDLSKVLFIATGNEVSGIPAPLQDRMEMIQVPGYTYQEKVAIARQHLVPKQLSRHGLPEANVCITDEALLSIARQYTRESGVRTLERMVAALCRSVATDVAREHQQKALDANPPHSAAQEQPLAITAPEPLPKQSSGPDPVDAPVGGDAWLPDGPKPKPGAAAESESTPSSSSSSSQATPVVHMMETRVIDAAEAERILGPPKYVEETRLRMGRPGVAIGMVWTQVGGELLYVETSRYAGTGKLLLTGKLGDVIKESAQTALSWLRTHAVRYGLAPNARTPFLHKLDLHVHFPAAAIPKDGPSAGVTITVCLLSVLTGALVRSDTAMTGELSLRGLVLPVGGIKEKVLAAHRGGIKRILLPQRNMKDLADVPEDLRKELHVIPCSTMEEVIAAAFDPGTVFDGGDVLLTDSDSPGPSIPSAL